MRADVAAVYAVLGVVIGVPVAARAAAWTPDRISSPLTSTWVPVSFESVTAGVASGALAGLVGMRLGASPAVPAFWVAAVLVVPLVMVDVAAHRLPFPLVAPIFVACLVCFSAASVAAGDARNLVRAVEAGLLVGGVGLVLALAVPGRLGLGDVVLAGGLALSLGWWGWSRVELGILSGLLLAAVVGAVLVVRHRSGQVRFALGPALVAGWLLAVLL